MKRYLTVAVLVAAGILAGCGTTTSTVVAHPPTVAAGNFEPANAHGCGVERWAVKTGTDALASQVNMTPQDTTISDLNKLPVPSGFNQDAPRLQGTAEMQVYRITGTLIGYKMEADGDYHLVVQDDQGNTMIVEIPDPSCVGNSSPWLQQIIAARTAFDTKFPGVSGSFQHTNTPVTITGVGFFDTIHGQTGVAPNGSELHPDLTITFG